MAAPVRVRFAPSPTGPLHIGGVRTALYNYLFARKHGGSFVLRIEDTDQKRFVEGAEQYIAESLDWLNIPYDEGPGREGNYGPYRQSERQSLYQEYVFQLIDSGWAYYAFDRPEALEAHRVDHEKKGKTFIYNWHNREKLDNSLGLTSEELAKRLDSGEAYTVRFKWPKDETLVFTDIIRGEIRIDTNTLDDKVLFKSDGMPTYHLANIVDDHLMEITHVIRGEEWLPSLALHVKLYEAFGWKAPEFAHLPLILKPSGKGKLSKRDGDKLGFPVFPLQWEESIGYREAGYFPEAVVNFLAFLGWNPGTEQELFSLEELVDAFSLERVHKSGARFDPDKNAWFNQHYLQSKPISALAGEFVSLVGETYPGDYEDGFLLRILELMRERAHFLPEILESAKFFFVRPAEYDPKAASKQWKPETPERMEALEEFLKTVPEFRSAELEASVKEWIVNSGYGFGQIMAPFRLALVGALQGPHLFDIADLLGREETLLRLRNAIESL
ncbi:glutamyl-tRNA synthetase [Robiginitalea myxolifaciens]|uniref:Glutamate--tRNA ligase n=1 Tax=Robiginitalea myxolifaciens TaxID=400055 RepID=A0A1I6G3B9_9FLAO|nr:glutamate--tRNA ligase [Robiginitalea myxolifaciens]SFR36610.1 glutamyl-tRNA synthetase [Robiginitalea myxolifaciens]